MRGLQIAGDCSNPYRMTASGLPCGGRKLNFGFLIKGWGMTPQQLDHVGKTGSDEGGVKNRNRDRNSPQTPEAWAGSSHGGRIVPLSVNPE